jgi:hypothetical protein
MKFQRKRTHRISDQDGWTTAFYKCEIQIYKSDGVSNRFISIQHESRRVTIFIATTLTAYLNLLQATKKFREIFDGRR